MSVDVTVLYFAGCPSWQTALDQVHVAAAQTHVDVSVSVLAVETQQEADRLGFTGSPTIWLDGVDPFATSDAVPALACRVYPTPDGLAGSPTVDQLAEALTRRAA
ncbi:DF family (seleno)protein [Pedococcus soli]